MARLNGCSVLLSPENQKLRGPLAEAPAPPTPGRTILELDDGKYGSARMARAVLALQMLV